MSTPQTIRVRLLRAVRVAGGVRVAGACLDVSPAEARDLLRLEPGGACSPGRPGAAAGYADTRAGDDVMNAAPTGAPRLPRALQRAVNRLAAQRARRELDAVWRRHRAALQAEAADLVLAGRSREDVLRELQTRVGPPPGRGRRSTDRRGG